MELLSQAPGQLAAHAPARYARHRPEATLLYELFGVEIETCAQCGGKVRVIASIEDPAVIARILGHVAPREPPVGHGRPRGGRRRGHSAFTEGLRWDQREFGWGTGDGGWARVRLRCANPVVSRGFAAR